MIAKAISIYILILAGLFLSACNTNKPLETKQQEIYGGTLKVNLENYILTLDPPIISDPFSTKVSVLIFEGLFELDEETLDPKPCLIKSFSLDSTKKEYSFELKQNIQFHKSPCFGADSIKTLNTDDVKYSLFRYLEIHKSEVKTDPFVNSILTNLNSESENTWFKKIDDLNFKITLKTRNREFINNLALPQFAIYPKDIFDCNEGKDYLKIPIGTGPFKFNELETGARIILSRNAQYHQKDSQDRVLPYLDYVKFSFIQNKEEEYASFLKEEISYIEGLPLKQFTTIYNDLVQIDNSRKSQLVFNKKPLNKFYYLGLKRGNSSFDFRQNIEKCISNKSIQKLCDNYLYSQVYAIDKEISNNNNVISLFNQINRNDSTETENLRTKKNGNRRGDDFSLNGLKLWVDQNDEKALTAAKFLIKEIKGSCGFKITLAPVPYSVLRLKIKSCDNCLYLDQFSQSSKSDLELIKFLVEKTKTLENKNNRKSESKYNYFYVQNDSISYSLKDELLSSLFKNAPIYLLWVEENYLIHRPYIKNLSNNLTQYRTFKDVYFQRPETLSVY